MSGTNLRLTDPGIEPIVGANTNVIRTRSGGGSVIVPLYPGVAIGSSEVVQGPVYWSALRRQFTVADYFEPGELVTIPPGGAMVFTGPRSVLLAHDPNIRPQSGIFIEPIHANLASNQWEALTKVAETFYRGADIEVVEFYNTDDAWANMIGKAIKFDSRFLNIRDGKAIFGGRASTVHIQDLKDRYLEKDIPNSVGADMRVPNLPNIQYVVESVITGIAITSTVEELLPNDLLGDFSQPTISFGEFEIPMPRYGEEFKYRVGEFAFAKVILPARSMNRYGITLQEYESRKAQVIQYLMDIRDVWIGKNSTDSQSVAFDNSLINEIVAESPNPVEPAMNNLPPMGAAFTTYLSMAIWHQLDYQVLTDEDVELDAELRQAIEAGPPGGIGPRINIADQSRYIAAYGRDRDDEGFYCRSLRITPIGPALQKYEPTLYRFPPQVQEGIDRAHNLLNLITDDEFVIRKSILRNPTGVPISAPVQLRTNQSIQDAIDAIRGSEDVLNIVRPR